MWAYWSRAQLYYRLSRYQLAIDDLTKASQWAAKSKNGHMIYNLRAKCYDKIGRHDLANIDRKKTEIID